MVLLVLIRKTLSISAALTVKNLSLILKLNAAMSSTYLTLPVLELPLNSDSPTHLQIASFSFFNHLSGFHVVVAVRNQQTNLLQFSSRKICSPFPCLTCKFQFEFIFSEHRRLKPNTGKKQT